MNTFGKMKLSLSERSSIGDSQILSLSFREN